MGRCKPRSDLPQQALWHIGSIIEPDDILGAEWKAVDKSVGIAVIMKDWRRLKEIVVYSTSQPESPTSAAEVEVKFQSLADSIRPAGRADDIVAAVREL